MGGSGPWPVFATNIKQGNLNGSLKRILAPSGNLLDVPRRTNSFLWGEEGEGEFGLEISLGLNASRAKLQSLP